MATFQNIKELTKVLRESSELLYDMFQKRKSVSVRYEDALETLKGDENKLRRLIGFGVVEQLGDLLELEDVYQRFFEEVLSVNEEINIASVQTYIDTLKLNIDSYLAAENNRKPRYLREIRHIFRSINTATQRNVVDLKRNIDDTYKQEPNFKIKELRLKDFDKTCELIQSLIRETEKVIEGQPIFFSAAMDAGMRQTISELRRGFNESSHNLIAIKAQIIDYLNRIEYQSRMVKKVRQLKYLRDQFMIADGTNIKEVAAGLNDVWMEKRATYKTKVSLDFLRNDDAALNILSDIRRRLSKKKTIKSRLAGRIDESFLHEQQELSQAFNHQEIINAFLAQGDNLFSYIWNYQFSRPADEEQRLVLFLQLASQFGDSLIFTSETATKNNIEFPLIYPK